MRERIQTIVFSVLVLFLFPASGTTEGLPPPSETVTVDGVSFEMVRIPGGVFQMGDVLREGFSDEVPVHEVKVSSFLLGRLEVTQRLWVAVMGDNPSAFAGDDLPVDSLDWDDCQLFLGRLNQLTGRRFRLPTEAEWEYAARGGEKRQRFPGGDEVESVGWIATNSGGCTHPVGSRLANGFGLHDMAGNVSEWCLDFYFGWYYQESAEENPRGPSEGTLWVWRGGSWGEEANFARTTCRPTFSATAKPSFKGMRLAEGIPAPAVSPLP